VRRVRAEGAVQAEAQVPGLSPEVVARPLPQRDERLVAGRVDDEAVDEDDGTVSRRS
jgi:hypothetical protein